MPSRILYISVYGAWTEAATSACVTSLDRAPFDQSADTNNSISNFCAEMYLFPEWVTYYNFILLKRPFRSRSRSVQPSMVFTAYTKRRILLYHGQGLCAPTIAKLLEDEGIIVSRRGVAKFILRVSREVYITRELRSLYYA